MMKMDLPELNDIQATDALSEELKRKLGVKYPMGVIVLYNPVEADMNVIPLNCSEMEACGMLAVAPSVVMDADYGG